MALKINGVDVTINRIDSVGVTQENLDGNKVYPDVMTFNMRINGGAWQTININPMTVNGRKCVLVQFVDPVLSISGVEGGSINIFPGNTVDIATNGFFTGAYGLDMGLNDITGNLSMSNFEFVVNPSNAYFSNLGAFMPNDIDTLMITVD